MSWSEIKKAINDNLAIPLNKLIGTANDTGGSTTTGSVMAKLNQINERQLSYPQNTGVIKHIQRGIVTYSTTNVTLSGFSNLNKMIVFLDNRALSELSLTSLSSYRLDNSDKWSYHVVEFY